MMVCHHHVHTKIGCQLYFLCRTDPRIHGHDQIDLLFGKLPNGIDRHTVPLADTLGNIISQTNALFRGMKTAVQILKIEKKHCR